MKAPRVLVCGTTLSQPMGGVQRHNRDLLPRLAKLLEQRGGGLAVMASRDGLAFELPGSIEVLPSRVPALPALARFVRESAALRQHLDAARRAGRPFDAVHTDHLPAPRGLDARLTLTLHDLKSVASAAEPLVRRLVGRRVIRDAVERAAAVACVSRTLSDEVEVLTTCSRDKLHVVPNGCDHLPLVPRAASARPFLLFVGRLEPRKNVELLLHLLAMDPQLPELVLAGGSKGDYEDRLRALALELGVSERVRFAGLQSDAALAELYSTCACVVLPSLREGFDLPLAEALRAGAPVAASNLPVHVEVAAGNAALFDPHDARGALAAIARARAASATPTLSATWDEAALGWLRLYV